MAQIIEHHPAPADIAAWFLSRFPPSIRNDVVEDAALQQEFGLSMKTTIRLGHSGITMSRDDLFKAARDLLAGVSQKIAVRALDGVDWQVERDDGSYGLFLAREGQRFGLPDFHCFAPEAEARIAWLDGEAKRFALDETRAQIWRDILADRAATDDEYDEMLSDIRLTPIFVAAAISDHLRLQTLQISELVPSDIRYYERLIGAVSDNAQLMAFVESTVASHIERIRVRSPGEALLQALQLCAHSSVSRKIDLRDFAREDVVRTYKRLAASGDRFSQLAGIECGLASLATFPELEPIVVQLVKAILADPAEPKLGQFTLLAGLIVLVDGELARIGVMKGRPVFWRRWAAITHASVLERQIVANGLHQETFVKWGFQGRGRIFFMQSYIDMRTERRWVPDFVFPQQLKAEFIGRIIGAARTFDGQIASKELRGVLFGKERESVEAAIVSVLPFLPGPLEGGVDAIMDMPSGVDEAIRAELAKPELSPFSFALLVNSALIYKIGSELAQLAAEALRRAKYQLRSVRLQDDSFSLLSGLATIAAVTLSVDLARELRVLTRAVRRRPGVNIRQEDALRICLVAAAAHTDRTDWCEFVGEWATELGYEDMSRENATSLHERILVLCQLEPQLWECAARAEAACWSFLASSAA